jgi:hypothetical protein
MFLIGAIVGAMLDPITAGAGIAAFFIGRAYPEHRAVVTIGAVVAAWLALFVLMLALAGKVPAATILAVLVALSAWVGICFGVAKIYAISSPPPKAAE